MVPEHRTDLGVGRDVTVQYHKRNRWIQQRSGHLRGAGFGGGKDDAVHLATEKEMQISGVKLRVAFRVGEHDGVPLAARVVLSAADDVGENRV